MGDLDLVLRRARGMDAESWLSLWLSTVHRLGTPCYRGGELTTWEWWAGEVRPLLSSTFGMGENLSKELLKNWDSLKIL